MNKVMQQINKLEVEKEIKDGTYKIEEMDNRQLGELSKSQEVIDSEIAKLREESEKIWEECQMHSETTK